MSIDVEDALLTLFQKYGNKTKEEANSYFSEIKKVGRYQKEVY